MAYKLLDAAQERWWRFDGHELAPRSRRTGPSNVSHGDELGDEETVARDGQVLKVDAGVFGHGSGLVVRVLGLWHTLIGAYAHRTLRSGQGIREGSGSAGGGGSGTARRSLTAQARPGTRPIAPARGWTTDAWCHASAPILTFRSRPSLGRAAVAVRDCFRSTGRRVARLPWRPGDHARRESRTSAMPRRGSRARIREPP